MIWIVIISSIAVAATYVGAFLQTRDTWTAVIAASIVSALAVIVIVAHATRPPVTRRIRWWALGTTVVLIAGIMLHIWVFYRMTHWQYDALHTIHQEISHGVAFDLLSKHGLKTLSGYYDRKGAPKATLGEVFQKNTHFANRDSSIVEVVTDANVRVFVAQADTDVVLIVQSTIRVDGQDPNFENFDGQRGAVQDRMRITRKGLVYELQN